MPPSWPFVAVATPADFSLPSPLPVHFLPVSEDQASGAAALRYFVKFSVVPDSSERKKTLIGVAGSVTPLLSAAMAGSFQVVILPTKIFVATSAWSTSLSTPLTLEAMAMGPVTMGRFQASVPQDALASSASILPSL